MREVATLEVCGGSHTHTHTHADSRSMWRGGATRLNLTLVGSAAWLVCRGKCAGRLPGELRGVTPHQAGLKPVVDGKKLPVWSLHLVKHSVSWVRCSASREGCGDVAGMFSHYLSHEVTPRPLVAVHEPVTNEALILPLGITELMLILCIWSWVCWIKVNVC